MEQSQSYMIQAEGLSKRFGERLAVDDVSFAIEKGEIMGFLGPNAAGKTTTMKMLTCFYPPTEGTAKVMLKLIKNGIRDGKGTAWFA